MEIAVRQAAARGRWDEVSKAGARLLNAQGRRGPSRPGKVEQRQTAAEAATGPASRFAPPPPPKPN